MQRIALFAYVLVSTLYLAACGKQSADNKPIRPKCFIQFHLQAVPEIVPFHPTKSIPGDIPSEPSPSIPGSDDSNRLFTQIEYAVYDKESSELIRSAHYTEENQDDFGSFLYDEFEAGTYIISLLAHAAKKTSKEGSAIHFTDVTDAFYAKRELTIDGKTDQTIETTLQRIVSRIAFVATDNIPQSATQLHTHIAGLYDTFNLLSGEATNKQETYTWPYIFTEADRLSSSKYQTSFLTFVPTTSPAYIKEVTLQTLDAANKILHSQTLSNIPIQANRTTRYTGILFPLNAISGAFELSIENNAAWGSDTTYTVP